MYAGLKNGYTEHYRELITAVIQATLEGNLINKISQIEVELCPEGKETNLQESVIKGLQTYILLHHHRLVQIGRSIIYE